MPEFVSTGSASFPVLVACGACGNVHDLLFVVGASFGLTGLLALGQYLLDRVRKALGHGRLTVDIVEAAICASDSRIEADARTASRSTVTPGRPSPR